MKRNDFTDTLPDALVVLTHAFGLFTDDGTLAHDGVLATGTHYRGTETLTVALDVAADGGGQIEIMQAGRANPLPTTALSLRFAAAWPLNGSAWVYVFTRGEWEGEILAATGPAEIH